MFAGSLRGRVAFTFAPGNHDFFANGRESILQKVLPSRKHLPAKFIEIDLKALSFGKHFAFFFFYVVAYVFGQNCELGVVMAFTAVHSLQFGN